MFTIYYDQPQFGITFENEVAEDEPAAKSVAQFLSTCDCINIEIWHPCGYVQHLPNKLN